MPNILIVGPGKLGSSLFRAYLELGYTSVFLIGRNAGSFGEEKRHYPEDSYRYRLTKEDVRSAGHIFLTVPDDQLSAAVSELYRFDLNGKVVIHTSGALPASSLQRLKEKGAALGSFHPMQTFSRRFLPSEIWRNVICSYQGAKQGLALVEKFCIKMNLRLILVTEKQKLALHLAAVVASNFDVALLSWAGNILQQEHLQQLPIKEIIYPIAKQTLENYRQKDVNTILSGPVLRGDLGTIQKHIEYLKENNPDEARLYARLSHWLAGQEIFNIQRRQELLDLLKEQ